MLRDSKQRLAPEPVRRWALRCGGGLLLGAGICAAAAGTAHADVPELTQQTRATVDSVLSSVTPSAQGTTSAGSASAPAKTENPAPKAGSEARTTSRTPATTIVKVTPPKRETGYVGRHRANAPAADDVTRTAGQVVGGTLDRAGKISGRLTDVVGGKAQSRRTGSAHELTAAPASGGLPTAVPQRRRTPQASTPGGVAVPPVLLPGPQLPGQGMPGLQFPSPQFPSLQFKSPQFPGWQSPSLLLPTLGIPSLQLPGLQIPGLQLPGLQVPGLQVPGLQLPGLQPPLGQTVLPDPSRFGSAPTGSTRNPTSVRAALVALNHPSTLQGLAGTASSHLSRVALPDAPSAPAAPRGPRPTGPVPALPAGTGAGGAVDQLTPWAEIAPATRLTPSGHGTVVAGRTGPAPRDLAGMPLITPD